MFVVYLQGCKKYDYFLYGFLGVWLQKINNAYKLTDDVNSYFPNPVKITVFTERGEKNQNKIKFHLYHVSRQ